MASQTDHIGMRYQSEQHAHQAWMVTHMPQGKSSFLAYRFTALAAAREAILQLSYIHETAAGDLTVSEVIEFGCYDTLDGQAEVVLVGQMISHAMWMEAKTKLEAAGGLLQQESNAPSANKRLPAIHTASASANNVVFMREQSQGPATYREHTAPCAADAICFLQQNPVYQQGLSVIVETPEGNFGRDRFGIYVEKLKTALPEGGRAKAASAQSPREPVSHPASSSVAAPSVNEPSPTFLERIQGRSWRGLWIALVVVGALAAFWAGRAYLDSKNLCLSVRIPNSECAQLYEIYQGFGIEGQLADKDTWCASNAILVEEGHVVKLLLGNCHLSSSPSSISGLPYLEHISLAYNNLSEIPDFDDLPNLRWLLLPGNNFSGEIPGFDNLPSLERLDLSENQFSGTVPDFADLPNLEQLDLSENQLSGAVPNFSSVPNLKHLDLSSNQLSGEIPDFEGLTNLWQLVVHDNELSGEIPNFSGLSNLKKLDLKRNNFSGEIPDFDGLPNLEQLSLSGNELSGEIPNFSDLPNLEDFFLGGNELSGEIPNFDGLPNLEHLFLDSNKLSGEIPNFDSLPNLEMLSLSNNELNGEIPDFDGLPNLEQLRLSSNDLSGEIPDFDGLPNLEQLSLGNNELSGGIPNFSDLPNLKQLYLSCSSFSGEIPNFDGLPNLEILDLRHSQFSGEIPDFENSPLLADIRLEGDVLFCD